ncbi:hypothetical protein ACOSQ3_010948 [Xanthoceras sorbifolium]
MARTTQHGVDKKCVDKRCVKLVPKQMVPVPYTMEELRQMFWSHDTNRDERLSRKELKDAFNDLGARIPGWRAHRALIHADDNGDGYVSEKEVDELVNYAVKLGYTVK